MSNFTAGGKPVVSAEELLIVVVVVADRRFDVVTAFLTTALGFVLASVAIFFFSLVIDTICSRVSFCVFCKSHANTRLQKTTGTERDPIGAYESFVFTYIVLTAFLTAADLLVEVTDDDVFRLVDVERGAFLVTVVDERTGELASEVFARQIKIKIKQFRTESMKGREVVCRRVYYFQNR
jgi:hypothetical protein